MEIAIDHAFNKHYGKVHVSNTKYISLKESSCIFSEDRHLLIKSPFGVLTKIDHSTYFQVKNIFPSALHINC